MVNDNAKTKGEEIMVEFKEISEPKILSGLSSPIYIDKVKLNKKIVTRSLKRIIDFFGR